MSNIVKNIAMQNGVGGFDTRPIGVDLENVYVSEDKTLGDFTGATSQDNGSTGLVPAPVAGDEEKVLRGDGTWGTVKSLNYTIDGANGTYATIQNSVKEVENVNIGTEDDPYLVTIKPNVASGLFAHVEGLSYDDEGFEYITIASGFSSHAEGNGTLASGSCSHAEGMSTTASGMRSHAEGMDTTARGNHSHAEGSGTLASGESSHAEGNRTSASSSDSHAEGVGTLASGRYSHAEGNYTTASGSDSHVQNYQTIAQGVDQTVIGRYNEAQGTPTSATSTDYAFIIGNGTTNANRSNAFAIQWDGTFVFADGTTITPAQFAQLKALLS